MRGVAHRHLLGQLLDICRYATATDLQHSERTVFGLNNMPHAQNVLVDRLDSAHESVRLGQLKVWRQCLAVAETR